MATRTQDIGELKGLMTSMIEKMEHFESKLFGNGQKGLIERTNSLEILIEAQCSAFIKDVEALKDMDHIRGEKIDKLVKSIDALTASVNDHHKDLKIHSLAGMINVKVIALLVFAVAVINTLIPPDLSLWELLRKLLGL